MSTIKAFFNSFSRHEEDVRENLTKSLKDFNEARSANDFKFVAEFAHIHSDYHSKGEYGGLLTMMAGPMLTAMAPEGLKVLGGLHLPALLFPAVAGLGIGGFLCVRANRAKRKFNTIAKQATRAADALKNKTPVKKSGRFDALRKLTGVQEKHALLQV